MPSPSPKLRLLKQKAAISHRGNGSSECQRTRKSSKHKYLMIYGFLYMVGVCLISKYLINLQKACYARCFDLLHNSILLRCPVFSLAKACVTHRPLPLAQVASSATGSASFAPPLEYPHTLRGRVACLWCFFALCQSVKNISF